MKNVLIVDDSNLIINMLSRILESHGLVVIGSAGNGNEGFQMYKELKPDVVFMDLTMPDYNGFYGLQNIIDYDKDASVIICSAMGQDCNIIECLQIGALDFIVKPFNESKVIEVLNKVLVNV